MLQSHIIIVILLKADVYRSPSRISNPVIHQEDAISHQNKLNMNQDKLLITQKMSKIEQEKLLGKNSQSWYIINKK